MQYAIQGLLASFKVVTEPTMRVKGGEKKPRVAELPRTASLGLWPETRKQWSAILIQVQFCHDRSMVGGDGFSNDRG